MAHFDNKLKVKGSKNRSTIDLSCMHVTTSDFNVVKPIYIKELVPGDHFTINTESLCRAQPLSCPTFGRIDLTTRSFFIPYRLAWKYFNDFYAKRPIPASDSSSASTTLLTSVPYINVEELANCICINNNGFVTTGTSDVYDVRIKLSNSTSYFKFTTLGRRLYDLFHCLGYQFTWDFSSTGTDDEYNVSLLPLFAWIKLFRDWFIPTQYQAYHQIEYFINLRNPAVTTADFKNLLNILKYMLYRYYNDDFASASMARPFSTNNSSSPSITFTQDISVAGNTTNSQKLEVAGSDQLGSSQSGDAYSTPWQMKAMMNIASLLQKYNLLSPRINDWLNAQFGIKSGAVRFDITEYLGHSTKPLNISEIVNTTSEDSASLYGKGIQSDNDHVEYSAEEFGFIVITSEIAPRYGYVDGIKPEVDKLKLDHFFTPDFDALGYDSIPRRYLNAPSDNGNAWSFKNNYVFGYLPKYSIGYKFGFDSLTGDFRISSLNTGLDSWELFRHIGRSNTAFDNNEDFRYSKPRSEENFDRIFIDNNTDNDHFILIFGFDVKANRPMLALNESWQLNVDHEETQGSIVENHGNLS